MTRFARQSLVPRLQVCTDKAMIGAMSRVQQIEAELTKLTPEEIREVQACLDELRQGDAIRPEAPVLSTEKQKLLDGLLFDGGACLVTAEEMKRLAYE